MGSTCEMLVSSVCCAWTSEPSDCRARLLMPLMGATTRV
jgi:hypothetical protein